MSDNLICCGIALTGFERLRRVLDARYWILDARYWILDTGYSILDTGYSILDTGYSILDTGCWPLVSCYRPLVGTEADPTCYSLLVTGLWQLVAVKKSQGRGFQEFGSWNAEGGKQEKKAQGASCRVSASSPLCAMLSALCFIIPQSEFNCLCLPSSVI